MGGRMESAIDGRAFEESIIRFYEANPDVLERLRRILRGQELGVSLRLLDFFVTNYARTKNVVIETPKHELINVYREYKSQLRGYSKKQFDPFARRGPVIIEFSHGALETTIAQLSFFRWAITRGIVDYAAQHATEIESFYAERKCSVASVDTKDLEAKTQKAVSSSAPPFVLEF